MFRVSPAGPSLRGRALDAIGTIKTFSSQLAFAWEGRSTRRDELSGLLMVRGRESERGSEGGESPHRPTQQNPKMLAVEYWFQGAVSEGGTRARAGARDEPEISVPLCAGSRRGPSCTEGNHDS